MNARSRRSGPGAGQWVALGMAVLVILGLTFALGLLVGRQWARQTPSAASESAKKSAAHRSGLAEARAERAPEMGERLTFYQTLTAPLNSGPSRPGKGEAAHRPEAPAKPQAAPTSAPAPTAPVDEMPPKAAEPAPTPPALPAPSVSTAKPADQGASDPWGAGSPQPKAPESQGSWTVQVAAFKERAQAERLQKQMAAAGFDAYVTEKSGEGQVQFRVRIGSFKTREEASRTAERIKAERSLAAFVTTR